MKKKLLSCALIAASVGSLFAFTGLQTSITGKISPVDGAESVWIINGKDSMQGVISSGNFSFSARPATYKILVHAKSPYKDVYVENVEVKSAPVDVGEIVLKK